MPQSVISNYRAYRASVSNSARTLITLDYRNVVDMVHLSPRSIIMHIAYIYTVVLNIFGSSL